MGVEAFSLYGLVGLQGADKTQKELDGVSKKADKTKGTLGGVSSGVKSFAGVLATATAAAAVFGVTWTKAMELGKEGAAIKQTDESFRRLTTSLGGSVDMLEELRAASKGTVDDLKLQSSTTALLSGASGELAKSLLNATPQLMEMAKAANKLNPTLGDTTYMYESLALGIKRGSPMILDNLGITISIEQANKKYADSLGVAVDKLSKEQQQQALLNAVMDKGNILIQQAGGNTDATGDSFARLDAAGKNLGDMMKTKLAPGLASAAEAAYILLTANKQIETALKEQQGRVLTTTQTYEDYVEANIDAGIAAKKLREDYRDVTRDWKDSGQTLDYLLRTLGMFTEEQYLNAKMTLEDADALKRWKQSADSAKTSASDLAAAAEEDLKTGFEEAKTAIEDYKDALDAAQESARAYFVNQSNLSESLKDAKNADLAKVAVDQLNQALQAGTITQGQYSAAVRDAQLAYGLANEKSLALAENIAAVTTAAATGVIPQESLSEAIAALNQDAADGSVNLQELLTKLGANADEAKAFADSVKDAALQNQTLADQTGKISESAIIAEDALGKMEDKFVSSKDKAEDSAGAVEGFAKQVAELRDRINELKDKKVTVTMETIKNTGSSTPVAEGGHGYASGADFVVPPGYPHDSYPLRAQSGERVIIVPPGQNAGGGGNRFYGNVTFVVQGGSMTDMMSQIRR